WSGVRVCGGRAMERQRTEARGQRPVEGQISGQTAIRAVTGCREGLVEVEVVAACCTAMADLSCLLRGQKNNTSLPYSILPSPLFAGALELSLLLPPAAVAPRPTRSRQTVGDSRPRI